MYIENTHASRSGFRYAYTAAELLPNAVELLDRHIDAERKAREQVIKLTRDPKVSPTDKAITEAKREAVNMATLVEELSVFVHEFSRNPAREYQLSSGDVVFFGLVAGEIRSRIESGIRPTN